MSSARERIVSRSSRKARERFEYRVARAMSALPPKAQVKLSRKPPVRVDGLTLDPEVQLSLAMMERQGLVALETLPVDQVREITRAQGLLYGGPGVEVGSVRDITIDGADGPLAARHYVPDEAGGPHPLLVYYHGGGWVIGDLDTHDALCRLLCKHAGVQRAGGRLPARPEHPFPAALDDARAALRWAQDHAESLRRRPGAIAVGGDSAGGNLAAVVCAARRSRRRPRAGVPALDLPGHRLGGRDAGRASSSREGFFLTTSSMEWFAAQYVGSHEANPADPRIPRCGPTTCRGSPPALIVTAGFDPLRDEGEAYAEALRAAGTPVVLRRFAGEIHGFVNAVGVSRIGRDAVIELAGTTRAMLSTASAAVARSATAGEAVH